MSRKGCLFYFEENNCAEGHIVNCAFHKRNDGATLFHFAEDKVYLDMVGYVVYPKEELPADYTDWPWRKVGRLLVRRLLFRPRCWLIRLLHEMHGYRKEQI